MRNVNQQINDRARRVALAIFDVDGILTDGTLYLSSSGESFKAFNILDGQGLKMLASTGIALGAITGRKSSAAARRAREIGIVHFVQGAQDKLSAYLGLLRKLRIAEHQSAYMGDDLPDLPVLRRCGLALTVPGAVELVRKHAHYVTIRHGGQGAVREVCELIMRAQGTLGAQLEPYLR